MSYVIQAVLGGYIARSDRRAGGVVEEGPLSGVWYWHIHDGLETTGPRMGRCLGATSARFELLAALNGAE